MAKARRHPANLATHALVIAPGALSAGAAYFYNHSALCRAATSGGAMRKFPPARRLAVAVSLVSWSCDYWRQQLNLWIVLHAQQTCRATEIFTRFAVHRRCGQPAVTSAGDRCEPPHKSALLAAARLHYGLMRNVCHTASAYHAFVRLRRCCHTVVAAGDRMIALVHSLSVAQ